MKPTSEEHAAVPRRRLTFALIVCSTSRYRALQRGEVVKDESGDLVSDLLSRAGHELAFRRIVPDDAEAIRKSVKEALDGGVDVVLTCGGTGIAPSDVTIEAVSPLLEKELPGFGELLRRLSYEEMGPSAMLTRALAGVASGKAIFCLPGSPHAINLGLKQIILPEIHHLLRHARER